MPYTTSAIRLRGSNSTGGAGNRGHREHRRSIVHNLWAGATAPFRRASHVVLATTISDVCIFYGSVTGTAKRFARTLAKEIAARGITVTTSSLRDFDALESLASDKLTPERGFVFVVATYGSGGPTPSAERFYEWLLQSTTDLVPPSASADDNPSERPVMPSSEAQFKAPWKALSSRKDKKRPGSAASSPSVPVLHGLQYAVFGTGSSQYESYNAMGKMADASLHALGGIRLCQLGLSDALSDPDTAFLVWKAHFLQVLPVKSVLPEASQVPRPSPLRSSSSMDSERWAMGSVRVDEHAQGSGKFKLRCTLLTQDDVQRLQATKRPSFVDHSKAAPPVEHARASKGPTSDILLRSPSVRLQSIRLHNDHLSTHRVALVTLALLDPDMTYTAGDAIALVPCNTADVVEELATSFGFDLDVWFDLDFAEPRDKHHLRQQLPFPTPCTVRTALTEYLDLHSVTRKFLRNVASYATVDRERETLERLSSTEGSEEFTKHFIRQHKGVLELMMLAPSLRIPFRVFVNIAPTLKPRYYSVACSPTVMPRHVQLSVSFGGTHDVHGVSVSFFKQQLALASPQQLDNVLLRAYTTPSRFRLPSDVHSPLILIANGVGVSPMRALLQQRQADLQQWQTNNANTPATVVATPSMLLFGCADRTSVLYEEDFRHWELEGVLQLRLAFSAQRGEEPQYVQDLVRQHLDDIFERISSCPHSRLYVCGKSDMARKVRQALQADKRCFANAEGTPDVLWFDALNHSGRYIEEIWG